MDDLFNIEPEATVQCKDCQFCNQIKLDPPYHSQNICINKKTTDKRYKFGYVTVRTTKNHYCKMFKKIK